MALQALRSGSECGRWHMLVGSPVQVTHPPHLARGRVMPRARGQRMGTVEVKAALLGLIRQTPPGRRIGRAECSAIHLQRMVGSRSGYVVTAVADVAMREARRRQLHRCRTLCWRLFTCARLPPAEEVLRQWTIVGGRRSCALPLKWQGASGSGRQARGWSVIDRCRARRVATGAR